MSEGFIHRWSRLKRREEAAVVEEEVVSGAKDETPDAPPAAAPTGMDEPEVMGAEAEVVESEEVPALTDADMPDLETITAGSDMSMFFSTGVSVELRRQALRRFFHQPEFNVRDPLDDYALDYSQPVRMAEAAATQVRRWAEGQLQDAMQQAQEALLEDGAAEAGKVPAVGAEKTPRHAADFTSQDDAAETE